MKILAWFDIHVYLIRYQKQMDMLPHETIETVVKEKQEKKIAAASQELKKLLRRMEKPKKPMSGYLLFIEEQRPKLPGGLSPTAAVKLLSSQWNALPAEKKAPFESKHALLKEEHEKAMKTWSSKMVREGKAEQVNVLREKLSSFKNPDKTDPLAKPKRSPSAFRLFQVECMKVPAFAKLSGVERRERISSKWQSMSEAKREPYELR